MKKTIGIVTTTRADYGIWKPLLAKLFALDDFDVKLIVSGTHLSPKHGYTITEIQQDNFPIHYTLELALETSSATDISQTMAQILSKFSMYLENTSLDLLLVLGDRYEILSFCIAAVNANLPIAHLHGGELTEGAVDDCIRHSITKLSHLHFTSTEQYRNRVIQMGENPKLVFNTGALGIDNIVTTPLLSKEELSLSLNIDLTQPFSLVTFHPVTLESSNLSDQLDALFSAIASFPTITFIFTYANADKDGDRINTSIDHFVATQKNCHVFPSLGMLRYLSACKYAEFVLGNSSSGILEVPCFHIPTINIGNRQKGRIQAKSIINCAPTTESIQNAILKAQSQSFRKSLGAVTNPYGDGHAADRMIDILRNELSSSLSTTKTFYDL